jgi:hypothetical protein
MSRLSSLPDEVLKLVMQHVPLEDRLTSCCLVNRKLHAAAVAATAELQLSFGCYGPPHQDEPCFLEWLSHYGQHLTSLDICHLQQPLQQLPCPNLLDLHLSWCSVQLGPAADGQPGVVQGCTKLTRLELWSDIIDSTGSAVLDGNLSSLVNLQSFELGPERGHPALSSAFPFWQRLTFLRVHSLSFDDVGELGQLTNLLELHLKVDSDVVVGPRSVPTLSFPESLTKLSLLSGVEAGMLSLVPTGLQDLFVKCVVEGPVQGPGSLLSGMARLQQLTSLCIHPYSQLDWPAPGHTYAALTASTNLVVFRLLNAMLPGCVWPFVFPATCKLLHLTCLHVDHLAGYGAPAAPSAWGAADVASLISCCPNLCEIYDIPMQHGRHVSELHKLTALTSLSVQYGAGSISAFEDSLGALAAVTQIQDLDVALDSRDLTVGALLPLTSLTALTNLWSSSCDGQWELQLTSTQVILSLATNGMGRYTVKKMLHRHPCSYPHMSSSACFIRACAVGAACYWLQAARLSACVAFLYGLQSAGTHSRPSIVRLLHYMAYVVP